MTGDHDELIALARKAIIAAGGTDIERLIEDLGTFTRALEAHLDEERQLLIGLPPVEARRLGRGQAEIRDAARALLDNATAHCDDLSGQCEDRVGGLMTLLTIQTRDEQVALHGKLPHMNAPPRTPTVDTSPVHRHEDPPPSPTQDPSVRTLVVVENSNCTQCHNRMLAALRARERVHRVHSDFATGCLVIEHEDDPDDLVSLITSMDRAVAVASNGEMMMVSLDYHEATECPVTNNAFRASRTEEKPSRISAPKNPSAGFTHGPSSDGGPVGGIASTASIRRPVMPAFDVVEEWGNESFPASDAPQSWCSERTRSERIMRRDPVLDPEGHR